MSPKLRVPATYRGDVPFVVLVEDQWVQIDDDLFERERYFELDGTAMSESAGVFREFARGLRLHAYFGHNWDALEECLGDMGEHVDADRIVIGIRNADALLELDDFKVFIEVICYGIEQAGAWCNDEGEIYTERRALLRVVLIVADGSVQRFADHLDQMEARPLDYWGDPIEIRTHRSPGGFVALSMSCRSRGYF